MNIDNKLDALSRIKQVDAPHFLLTRIKQQIRNLENAPAPVQWTWAFAASTVVVIALNLFIFLGTNDSSTTTNTVNTDGIETVVSSMHLTNTNTLYNE